MHRPQVKPNQYLTVITIICFVYLVGIPDAPLCIEAKIVQEEIKMKKTISTIAAIGFISSMLVNTAYADHGHLEILNPLWVPAAILSTVAATVTAIVQPPVIYEQRVYSEPRQTVIYEEPRHFRHEYYYERGPANYYYGERRRSYDAPRHHEYR
jgi:hypothetical protein